jgi:hypothetical protein
VLLGHLNEFQPTWGVVRECRDEGHVTGHGGGERVVTGLSGGAQRGVVAALGDGRLAQVEERQSASEQCCFR